MEETMRERLSPAFAEGWLLPALNWLPSSGWSETSVTYTLVHPMMRCREFGWVESYNTEPRPGRPVKLRWRLTEAGRKAKQLLLRGEWPEKTTPGVDQNACAIGWRVISHYR